jgi:CRISPR system Cascade subunit CasD
MKAAHALRCPVWGVWLGRKACVPSSPILIFAPDIPDHSGVFSDKDAAWKAALSLAAQLDGDRSFPTNLSWESFARVEDADFKDGTDTFNDRPLSFGKIHSSGVEGRHFAPRRVKVVSKSPLETPSTST